MKSLQDSGPSVPISIVRSSAMDTEVTDHGSHANDEQDEIGRASCRERV